MQFATLRSSLDKATRQASTRGWASLRVCGGVWRTSGETQADMAKQVYAILDEVFLAGEIEETSKQVVLTRLEHLDKLE